MSLVKEFERTGNLLFKYRSYIPLLLYVIVIPVLYFDGNDFFGLENLWWALTCFLVSFAGQIVRGLTIGFTPQNTSGRNTSAGQVAEQLNTKGMYSVVRHPLYLGNFLMWLGLIMFVGSLEFLIFAVFFFWIYYERIMFAEEQFISNKFGEQFANWSAVTPAFFPKIKGYIKADVPFSLKNVLKREYHGFYAVVISFTVVHIMKQLFINEQFVFSVPWVVFFLMGTIFYIVVRVIVKTTAWLHVEGR
jgi:protein-S-isoprenylcysteine O-methyltransferase Ste14